MNDLVPLAIIGAGPAGIAAAIESVRQDVQPMVFEASGRGGGLVRWAHEVRNIPFLGSEFTTGLKVADRLEEFRKTHGIDLIRASIVSITRDITEKVHDVYVLTDSTGMRWRVRKLIVATGTRARIPEISGLPSYMHYPWIQNAREALRHFAGYPQAGQRHVGILGSSDVAFDQARYLCFHRIRTTVLCRSPAPRAPLWLQKAARREGVEVISFRSIKHASMEPRRVLLKLEVGEPQPTFLSCDCLIPAIGRSPSVVEGDLDSPGIRIAGDALGRKDRHVCIAMSDGVLVAADLLRELRKETKP